VEGVMIELVKNIVNRGWGCSINKRKDRRSC